MNKIVFQTHDYIAIFALLFEYLINRLCVELHNILDDDIFIILPMIFILQKVNIAQMRKVPRQPQ